MLDSHGQRSSVQGAQSEGKRALGSAPTPRKRFIRLYEDIEPTAGHSQNKGNADQLGAEVIGMLWEVGLEKIC